MITFIIIFFISLAIVFGMLSFRAWKIETSQIIIKEAKENYFPELSFRHIEKIILFLTKHIIQYIVLFSAKTWFTLVAKIRILVKNKLPKINNFLKKKIYRDSRKISFVQRAVIESKIKIKKVKEKIKKEHEEIEEVDKIL